MEPSSSRRGDRAKYFLPFFASNSRMPDLATNFSISWVSLSAFAHASVTSFGRRSAMAMMRPAFSKAGRAEENVKTMFFFLNCSKISRRYLMSVGSFDRQAKLLSLHAQANWTGLAFILRDGRSNTSYGLTSLSVIRDAAAAISGALGLSLYQ